jgi:hypothetical protein
LMEEVMLVLILLRLMLEELVLSWGMLKFEDGVMDGKSWQRIGMTKLKLRGI